MAVILRSEQKANEHRSKTKQPRGLYCVNTGICPGVPAACCIDLLLAGIAVGGRPGFGSLSPWPYYVGSSDRQSKTKEEVLDSGGNSGAFAHRSADRDILRCEAVYRDLARLERD